MDKNKFFNKNNILLFIIILVIVVLLNIIGLALIKENVTKNEENKNIETKTDYNLKYNGYLFTIPLSLQHEIIEDNLLISNKVNNWEASTIIVPMDYETIYKNENKEKNLKDKDIKVKDILEKTYAGTTYLTIQITYNDENALLAISNLSGGNSIMFVITNQDNDYYYNSLVELSPVVKSASYYGENSKVILSKFNKEDIISSLMG